MAAFGLGTSDAIEVVIMKLASAERVDRLEVLKGAAAPDASGKKGGVGRASLSICSSMSDRSGSSLASPGSPTGPPLPPSPPPSPGFWGALRAWVGDGQAAWHRPVPASRKEQRGKASGREKGRAPAQRIKARAPSRSAGSSDSSELCCSARANEGHRPKALKPPPARERGSPKSTEELCSDWQPHYEASTRFLQTCLDTRAEEATLSEAVADVHAALHAVVALRQAALREDRLEEVLAGAFFRPDQRLLLWLGGIRPTDMLVCARIKMSMLGERLAPKVQREVEALQTACRARQTALTRGFEELSEKLARAAAVAQLVVAARARSDRLAWHACGCDDDVRAMAAQGCEGTRDAMKNMLIQADELRARLLEQLAAMLTPRQLALVLMAPLDMVASPL